MIRRYRWWALFIVLDWIVGAYLLLVVVPWLWGVYAAIKAAQG